MKLISWNVNGLRACVGKGFFESMAALDADVIALQETKIQAGQFEDGLEGYRAYYELCRQEGVFRHGAVHARGADPGYDRYRDRRARSRGRVITAEYDDFYLVVCYTPNAQRELARLDYRMSWERDFREYLVRLDRVKPVILTGDLNVAHEEIDLKNPKTNHMNAGFSDQERAAFMSLVFGFLVDFLVATQNRP